MQKLLLIVFFLTVVLITLISINLNFSKTIAQENGYDDYSYYNDENHGYVEGNNKLYPNTSMS